MPFSNFKRFSILFFFILKFFWNFLALKILIFLFLVVRKKFFVRKFQIKIFFFHFFKFLFFQVCSMHLPMDQNFIDNGPALLNTSLPEDIHVFAVRRVVFYF